MKPISLFRSVVETNGRAVILYQVALLTCMMIVCYILYCMKDSLLVHHLGPEAVVFVRSYLVTPAIFLFFLFYTKLLNWMDQSRIFNLILLAFVSYFLLFSFYLYPRLLSFSTSDSLVQMGFELITKWPITLHYLLSELWVTFVVGVMTWQIFNAINTRESASEVYYLMQLVSNGAIVLAGVLVYQSGRGTESNWHLNIQIQTVLIALLAFLAIFLKNRLIANVPETFKDNQSFQKLKLPLRESLKLILSSRKLRFLFLILFSYGICNSFLETANRFYLKSAVGSIQEYNNIVALQATLIGAFTIAFIFLGAFLSKQKRYSLSLKITPLLLLICSLATFLFSKLFFTQALWGVVFLSILQLVLVKSSKYGLVDPIKEISYISLDKELKNKGKAAVDGISNRFGKTGGNLLQQLLFFFAGGLAGSIEIFIVFVFIFALIWVRSASRLEV